MLHWDTLGKKTAKKTQKKYKVEWSFMVNGSFMVLQRCGKRFFILLDLQGLLNYQKGETQTVKVINLVLSKIVTDATQIKWNWIIVYVDKQKKI